jgi:transaldolase
VNQEQNFTANIQQAIVTLSNRGSQAVTPRFVSSPLLHSLMTCGTSHIYADTADQHELAEVLKAGDGEIYREVDGNTVNQPLVHKVIDHYAEREEVRKWAQRLRTEAGTHLTDDELIVLLYSVVCGRIANDIVCAFAGGRPWEISLQLHMGLVDHQRAAKQVAHLIRAAVPTAIVKVPFAPHAPNCLLIARDLEDEGIPVNFTSTFSARQVLAAALLPNVTRTNVFMGRLNQGLRAQLLGEHTCLEAQRAILRERHDRRSKTQLIVASVREWHTFPRTAGCDVYTSPCHVLRDFLSQAGNELERLTSQLETSYADKLGIASEVSASLGEDRIARLYRIEDEFVEFLREYRESGEFAQARHGDDVFQRFDRAGFGDFFYSPKQTEWDELHKDKLPDLKSPLARRCALDTLYSLLADADFAKIQHQMDSMLRVF